MQSRFIAEKPHASIIAELASQLPANPFATAEYFQSMSQLGYAAWVIGIRSGNGCLTFGCGAFLRKGRFVHTLEIPSLPAVNAQSRFWRGLRDFCRTGGVSQLELCTFSSPPGVEIPAFGMHDSRRSKSEYVLDLAGDLSAMLHQKHKASIKKAQNSGLAVARTRSTDALIAHHSLINQSMDRRRSRGESVGASAPSPELVMFLQSGAGELFQAHAAGNVLSSALVLHAAQGAYLQSTGTSPAGMAVGASHFLIHGISHQLKVDGTRIFNLGGAEEESSLARFKKRFGTSPVPLPVVSSYIGPAWRRKVSRAISLVKHDRKALLRLLVGQYSRMFVYAANTLTIAPPESQDDLTFRALTADDLEAISVPDPSFRTRQLQRLKRFGTSHAYAVFVGNQIAHISWLLLPAEMEKDIPRVVRGNIGVAEISGCETLPEFRGRGLYRVAIRNMLNMARQDGIQRVFMKTRTDNTASQSGIEKAGLQRVGSAYLIVLPLFDRQIVWRCFR